jgi:hypothetical protein
MDHDAGHDSPPEVTEVVRPAGSCWQIVRRHEREGNAKLREELLVPLTGMLSAGASRTATKTSAKLLSSWSRDDLIERTIAAKATVAAANPATPPTTVQSSASVSASGTDEVSARVRAGSCPSVDYSPDKSAKR